MFQKRLELIKKRNVVEFVEMNKNIRRNLQKNLQKE